MNPRASRPPYFNSSRAWNPIRVPQEARNGHNMWRFAETNREKRRKIRRKVYAFHLTDFWDSRSLYVRASACVEISQRNASILLTADRQFWSALKLGISPDGYGNPTVVNQ